MLVCSPGKLVPRPISHLGTGDSVACGDGETEHGRDPEALHMSGKCPLGILHTHDTMLRFLPQCVILQTCLFALGQLLSDVSTQTTASLPDINSTLTTEVTTSQTTTTLQQDTCGPPCSCDVTQWTYDDVCSEFHPARDDNLFVASCTDASLKHLPLSVPLGVKILNVTSNRLQANGLERILSNFVQLQELRIARNHIYSLEDIDPDFVAKDLVFLDLSDNFIDFLVNESFWWALGLIKICVSRNKIETIEVDALRGLKNLCHLDLSGNRIYEVNPVWFTDLQSLRILDMSDNSIDILDTGGFQHLTSLETLILAGNRIAHVESNAFLGLPALQRLDLSRNRLQFVPSTELRNIPRIAELILDNNLLKRLGGDNAGIQGVNVVVLSLRSMPYLQAVETAAFVGLSSLRRLYLSHSPGLQYLAPDAFSEVSDLELLDLADCDLSVVAGHTIHSLPALRSLTLSDNPFHCDCSLRWLRDRLRSASGRLTIERGDELRCFEPRSYRGLLLANVTLGSDPIEQCPPRILPLFHSQHNTVLEENLRFDCRAVGSPTPNVTWVLPNVTSVLPNVSRVGDDRNRLREDGVWITESGSLLINNVEARNAGVYTCMATNSVGTDSRELHVRVKNAYAELVFLGASRTSIKISWHVARYLHAYHVRFRTSGLNGTYRAVYIHPYMRTYTFRDLSPRTSYEFCIAVEHGGSLVNVNCSVMRTSPRSDSLGPSFRQSDSSRRYYVIGGLLGGLAFLVGSGCIANLLYKLYDRRKQRKREVYLDNSSSLVLTNPEVTPNVAFENQVATVMASRDTNEWDELTFGRTKSQETTSLAM